MKYFVTVILTVLSFSVFAAERIEVADLPISDSADTEVSTNIALKVDASRLEQLTFSISFDSCDVNEVLVALGTDANADGDLSMDEADIVFGCDCGAWYRADLRTGESVAQESNILVIGKREFDPSWDLFKVVRRGAGDIGESVSLLEDRIRFYIYMR